VDDLWTYVDVWAIAEWLAEPYAIYVVVGVICAIFIGYHSFRGYLMEKAEASDTPPSKADAFVSRAVIIVPGVLIAGSLFWLANFGIGY